MMVWLEILEFFVQLLMKLYILYNNNLNLKRKIGLVNDYFLIWSMCLKLTSFKMCLSVLPFSVKNVRCKLN